MNTNHHCRSKEEDQLIQNKSKYCIKDLYVWVTLLLMSLVKALSVEMELVPRCCTTAAHCSWYLGWLNCSRQISPPRLITIKCNLLPPQGVLVENTWLPYTGITGIYCQGCYSPVSLWFATVTSKQLCSQFNGNVLAKTRPSFPSLVLFLFSQ